MSKKRKPKRIESNREWGKPHPTRPWLPDMPGHQQGPHWKITDSHKEWLVKDTKRIWEEIQKEQEGVDSPENKG